MTYTLNSLKSELDSDFGIASQFRSPYDFYLAVMAKCALSQPAGFEFYHQSADLSATTPLPNAYYFARCHADSASKTRSLD
jgi:hypothetical protein